MYYLGIDAGGSSCKARISDANGTVLGAGRSGPANARIGAEALYSTLMAAAEEAMSSAGIAPSALGEIRSGMGIAGISRRGVLQELEAIKFPFQSVAFATDGYIANMGAHYGRDGAILIIGTGSIAEIRLHGQVFSIGGYGFPISDEGSGAALGLSAMRHALRALDGRTKPTPLSSAITARFGHDTARAVEWMDAATPRDYGGFAPVVLDFAEAHDEIALTIVEEAARHIERFIDTIFLRGIERCCLVGGLADRMKPWLKARTVERLAAPYGDQLSGALMLAGWKPDYPGDAV